MALSTTIYNTLIKRNSVFVGTIFVTTFGFAVGFDSGINSFWDYWNRGKQWKDIRDRYVTDSDS